MKQNLIFIAEKLGLLACVIFIMAAFGRVLHKELDAKWTNAFVHYFFVWFSFACLLVLLFTAFYLAHEVAVRDYSNKKNK